MHFNSNFVKNITSSAWADDKHDRIDDNQTFNDTKHYGADFHTPEDHGTAHVSVIAANGDAVAVTTTINLSFGSEVLSPSTGTMIQGFLNHSQEISVAKATIQLQISVCLSSRSVM